MTASTEQERAEFEAWARDRYPSIDLTRDGGDYSKALAKDYWSLWQAARRAPVVPMGAEHWAELHRLRAEVARSDGTKWQEVAAQE